MVIAFNSLVILHALMERAIKLSGKEAYLLQRSGAIQQTASSVLRTQIFPSRCRPLCAISVYSLHSTHQLKDEDYKFETTVKRVLESKVADHEH